MIAEEFWDRIFSDDLQARTPMITMVEYYGEVPTISESRLSQKCQSRVLSGAIAK